MEQTLKTLERYTDFNKGCETTMHPSKEVFRRYPYVVRLPFVPKNKDPRKTWLYDIQHDSRWYTLDILVSKVDPVSGLQLYSTAEYLREYRFTTASDQLLFQLRWSNTEQ